MSQEALQAFRQRYPEYRDLSDGELARKLVAKDPEWGPRVKDIAKNPAAGRIYTWGKTAQSAIESLAPPLLATAGAKFRPPDIPQEMQ